MNKVKHLLELYTDFLLTQNGQATATALSRLVNGRESHDKITRFLNSIFFNSNDLWKYGKSTVKQHNKSKNGVLILDDTIEEKPYTKENDIVCWHYDHSKGKTVKGINIQTCMFENNGQSIPVGYEIIKKTEYYYDKKTGKTKRKAQETKNEKFRRLVYQAYKNKVPFKYVLADSWYCSKENINFINSLGKKFVIAIESNRLISLNNQEGRKTHHYLQLKKADLEANKSYSVNVKGVDYPLTLLKKVFKNGDGSVGTLYLISNDLTLNGKAIYELYQRRWSIENYHRSIKQNASLAKSPCWKEKTQANHIFLALVAFCKLEILKSKVNLNHYEIRNQLLLMANIAAYEELRKLQKMAKSPA